MPTATILGLQWGDEGKGKIIDSLAAQADYVVRYQGGGNAGHTVIVDDTKHVFHHVPTGILYPEVTCVVGNGTVLDIVTLQGELEGVSAKGISLDGLRISDRAHVVFPYHKALDEAREVARADGTKIGTTKRGIGPCYADKASRTGIRIADLYDEARFTEKLRRNLDEKNAILKHLFGQDPLEFAPIRDASLAAAEVLKPYVTDTGHLVRGAMRDGKRVLFEGAQGAMLDLDHGTYPFVTSSSASSAGVPSGAGVPPSAVGQVLGVAKAYTTRVGAGPFPSELQGPREEALRERGSEFGATTGRARRCGWLDLVQLRYAAELTGATGLVLTKLDTLAGFGPLEVVTGYRDREVMPAGEGCWDTVEPILEPAGEIPADSVADVRSYDDLPAEAKAYIERVEAGVGVPVAFVSVGPERKALIQRVEVFS